MWKKPEARKGLENAADSHPSAARFVGRQFDFAGKTPLTIQNETFAAHG
jgi:hypothetical protein